MSDYLERLRKNSWHTLLEEAQEKNNDPLINAVIQIVSGKLEDSMSPETWKSVNDMMCKSHIEMNNINSKLYNGKEKYVGCLEDVQKLRENLESIETILKEDRDKTNKLKELLMKKEDYTIVE